MGKNKPNKTTALDKLENDVDVYELATFGSIYPTDTIKPLTRLAALAREWRDNPDEAFRRLRSGEMLMLLLVAAKRAGQNILYVLDHAAQEAADCSTEYHRQLSLMSDDGAKEPPAGE